MNDFRTYHRIFLSLLLAAMLGMGTALAQPYSPNPDNPACDNTGDLPPFCDEDAVPSEDYDVITDSITQDINVRIPTVVRLVLDDRLNKDHLKSWNLNFKTGAPEQCFVLPNWVGFEGHGPSFQDFAAFAESHGGLVAWTPDMGYPAIISVDGGNTVATWGEATDNGAYHTRGTDVPAKGNVACKYEFMVEKYTNLPDGANFDVELTTDSDGFGTLYIEDVMKANGIDHVFTTGNAEFSSAGSDNLVTVAPNHFYDDYVTQWIDLTASQPGKHDLTLTYTLSAAVAE